MGLDQTDDFDRFADRIDAGAEFVDFGWDVATAKFINPKVKGRAKFKLQQHAGWGNEFDFELTIVDNRYESPLRSCPLMQANGEFGYAARKRGDELALIDT